MGWIVYIYIVASLAIAVSAGINAGWGPGLSAFGASALALVAGGGLKASLHGDRTQKIGGLVIALVVAALAVWVGGGFTATLWGLHITGATWALIGGVVCFVFTTREMAFGRQ